MQVAELVNRLGLVRHPEGGWFRETYRAPEAIGREALPARFGGARAFSTAILYLLEHGDRSHLHRIAADEVWHFHLGDPLTVHVLTAAGAHEPLVLGPRLDQRQVLQGVVPAGRWFGARHEGPRGLHGYSLVGCTVAPGFDFADFELARREELAGRHPEHRALIEALTD